MRLIGRTLSQILVVSAYFVANSAFALNVGELKRPADERRGLVNMASVMGEDNRMTFSQYATNNESPIDKVESNFAATGIINCDDDGYGTAQVTGSRAVITTSAHVFNDDNCNAKPRSKCVFYLIKKDQFIIYPIQMASIRNGGCAKTTGPGTDWAVMELETAVPKTVTPYLTPTPTTGLNPDKKILHLSGYADNFIVNGKTPRFISNCNVTNVNLNDKMSVKTDCDTGHGSSGSAQLQEGPFGLTMVAIHVASAGDTDGAPYDTNSHFNTSALVNDKFLEAILNAVASSTARLGAR